MNRRSINMMGIAALAIILAAITFFLPRPTVLSIEEYFELKAIDSLTVDVSVFVVKYSTGQSGWIIPSESFLTEIENDTSGAVDVVLGQTESFGGYYFEDPDKYLLVHCFCDGSDSNRIDVTYNLAVTFGTKALLELYNGDQGTEYIIYPLSGGGELGEITSISYYVPGQYCRTDDHVVFMIENPDKFPTDVEWVPEEETQSKPRETQTQKRDRI